MSFKARAISGAAWIAAARVIVNLIGLLSTLSLARLLTPDDFGLVAIATTILLTISSVTELSLSSALVQHDNPGDSHYDSAFSLNVIRSVIASSVLLLLSKPIAYLYEEPRLINIIYVLAFSVLVMGFYNPKYITFTRNLNFRSEFFLNIIGKMLGFAVAIIIAIIYRNYWSLVLGSLATQFSIVIISYIQIPYRPSFSSRDMRQLLSFSIWLSFSQLINTLNNRLDQLVIGYYLGRSEVGKYSMGDNLANLPTRELTQPIAQMLFPSFARMTNDKARLQKAYELSQVTLASVAFPVGIGFAIIAHPFVSLTIGEKWSGVETIIQVISVAAALQTLSSPVQPVALAYGRTKLLFQRDLINLIHRLPFTIGGLYAYGLTGAVFGRALSALIGMIINMALAQKITGLTISYQLFANRRNLFASFCLVVNCYLATYLIGFFCESPGPLIVIMLMALVGMISYSSALWLAWVCESRPNGPEAEFTKLLKRVLNSK